MSSMINDIQTKIRPEHLERDVCVYVRQSSLFQVEHNMESARRQYGLVDQAMALGWPREHIFVLDEDQGTSSSTPGSRAGFEQLAMRVARGELGMVMSLEASRLARNNPDWHSLVYVCRWTATLIADETGIYDPALSTDRMILGLRGALSELELDTSIKRMHQARWSKAQRGELRMMLPAGYEHDDLEQIVITSDEAVAQAIRQVFDKFDELGSARQVYIWWKDQGLPYPRRRKELRSHPVVWVPIEREMIRQTLINPLYAGAYVFGKTQNVRKLDPDGSLRVCVRRCKRDEWPILIKDHHPSYITFEKYLEIRRRLRGNNTLSEERRQGGPGPAREGRGLLQGLARCGRCGRAMFVQYAGRGPNGQKSTVTYSCKSEDVERGRKLCQIVGGKRIEAAVVAAFLEATAPAGIEAAAGVAARIRRQRAEVERSWSLQIEKAEYEAQRAERQFNAVEPENRVVVRELERRWNARLLDVEALRNKAQAALAELQPLTEAELEQAEHLALDLEVVWNASTTTTQDRKRLLRCIIEEVQLRTEEKRYLVRIVWKGGAVTDREVVRLPLGAHCATPEDTVELIRRLAEEFRDEQIMYILNKQGRRSGLGRSFTKEAVRCIRREHEIPPCPKQQARDEKEGPFTAEEAASELGVSMNTIHRWLRSGVLAGRQATPTAPWRIVLTDEIRRRLTVGDAPEGWVALGEAAKRLGLSKAMVAHLVNTGKLPAVRTRVRNRECWRIDVSDNTCGRQTDLLDQMSNRMGKES